MRLRETNLSSNAELTLMNPVESPKHHDRRLRCGENYRQAECTGQSVTRTCGRCDPNSVQITWRRECEQRCQAPSARMWQLHEALKRIASEFSVRCPEMSEPSAGRVVAPRVLQGSVDGNALSDYVSRNFKEEIAGRIIKIQRE